ncbi:MAG: neutral zinc metallopeptidase [Dehalococcoidia bacterium]|nr:neutral zinc metallopeptidase [Dehalococcoidia bacterium]
MTFNPNAPLDPSQVRDRRRISPTPIVVGGGGGIGLLALIIAVCLGVNPFTVAGPQGGTLDHLRGHQIRVDQQTGGINDVCRTGADANRRDDCRIVGYVNSVQAYWQDVFRRQGQRYPVAPTVFFSGAIQTGCGPATSDTGPFYCPADRTVYLDLEFFQDLQRRFGARGGSLAQGYVIAHEYGHHVQNVLGILAQRDGRAGPTSTAVLIELQADCLAGVWAANATRTGFLQPLTREQISDALDAAAAVGDDRIQLRSQGRVTPETWTHGSSEQRQLWFLIGYQSGNPNACDPFSAARP